MSPVAWSATTMATESFGPSCAARSPPSCLERRPAAAGRPSASICAHCGCAVTASSARCAASIGNSRRAVGIGSRLAAAASSAQITPGANHAVEHQVARRERHLWDRGPAVAPRAIAAAPPAAPPRPSSAASAPCRNRRGSPRGCLRCCRHRAPASGRASRISSLLSCCSSASACTICRSLAGEVARRLAARSAAPPAWSASSRPRRCAPPRQTAPPARSMRASRCHHAR